MSPGLKSIVSTLGPVLNTPMRPLPLMKYCHSSAFGCQCICRNAPGRIVTSAAAMVVETLKVLLSAICTVPPFVWLVGADDARENVNGYGGAPADPVIACRTAGSSPGTLPWKIQRSCSGIFA